MTVSEENKIIRQHTHVVTVVEGVKGADAGGEDGITKSSNLQGS